MKKRKIKYILANIYTSKGIYSIISIAIIASMSIGVTTVLRKDIKDLNSTINKFIHINNKDDDIKEFVSNSMYRGVIHIKGIAENVENQEEVESTNGNSFKDGYDNYIPTQQIVSSNSSSSANSNNISNDNGSSSGNNQSNTNNAETNSIDKSSFVGNDVIISEGQPFNPMNALQLSATDINGENITNSIVITENNVDIYKPGVYTVKAYIQLKNDLKLSKSFEVRVKPTILDLAVNDINVYKATLHKNEKYNISFSVYSSKEYLDVQKVVINKEEYEVKKAYEEGIKRYEVELEAPNKIGESTLKLQKVIMSDGTVVDVDKSFDIEVLKDDAYLTDVVIEDQSTGIGQVKIDFNLIDVDDAIHNPKICIYNENEELILEKEVQKSIISSTTTVSTTMNIDKSGTYTIKVIANKDSGVDSDEIELLSTSVNVNIKNPAPIDKGEDSEDKNENLEKVEQYSLKTENSRASNANITGSDAVVHEHEINIVGNVVDDKGQVKPGTLQVVVPTTAAFRIDKEGNFITSAITIKNEGTQSIDVYAYKFIDVNGAEGIDIKANSEVVADPTNKPRNNIALNIFGNRGTAYFKSEEVNSGSTGIYSDENLKNNVNDGIKISTINAGSSNDLTLSGEPGKKKDGINTAIRDTFTLILKIKKATN